LVQGYVEHLVGDVRLLELRVGILVVLFQNLLESGEVEVHVLLEGVQVEPEMRYSLLEANAQDGGVVAAASPVEVGGVMGPTSLLVIANLKLEPGGVGRGVYWHKAELVLALAPAAGGH
jgi:hypothetical protein